MAPRTRSTRWIPILLATGALATLAACGSSKSSSSGLPGVGADANTEAAATTAAASGSSAAATTTAAGGAAKGVGGVATNAPSADTPLPADRKLIMTAGVEVEVKDVLSASFNAKSLAERLGGHVGDQQTNLGVNPSSVMVLRVPPNKMSTLLNDFGDLGKVLGLNQKADDVTTQYVDLGARILTAERSVERVRDLMQRTGTLAEQAAIERELSTRETTLEQLKAQRKGIDDRSEFASVTLTLRPIPVTAKSAEETAKKDKLPGWKHTIKTSLKWLATAAYVVAIALLAAAPWLILAGIIILPLWLIGRRQRRHHQPADTTLAPPVGPEREQTNV